MRKFCEKQSNELKEINLFLLITFLLQLSITLVDIKLSTNDDMDNTKFLFTFTKNILKFNKSIRWIGITDQDGNIINERDREGLKRFLL